MRRPIVDKLPLALALAATLVLCAAGLSPLLAGLLIAPLLLIAISALFGIAEGLIGVVRTVGARSAWQRLRSARSRA